ncbi:MAG: hypothetical protein AAFY73_04760 [Pseudomonadota bacterium]
MAITSLSSFLGTTLTGATVDMRNDMRALERQLATGKKADNYAELGHQRRLSVSFRQTIAQIDSWSESTKLVDMRVSIADVTLTRMQDLRTDAKAAIDPSNFTLNGGGKTSDQQVAQLLLEEFHALLQSDVGGRHIFGGREVNTNPVEGLNSILYGNGTQAGVNTYIDERRQADQGANGLGRLTVPALGGTTVSFQGEAPGNMPFGAKITSITSDTPAMVSAFTPQAGAVPAAASVNFAAQPNVGQKVRIEFELPNGETNFIELRADNTVSTDDSTFQIGATPADTAQNFRDVLENQLRLQANSHLEAASSIQAAYEFFRTGNGADPQRVDGPPLATATALMAGTPGDTVQWYRGENTTESAREGAVTRVDREQTVSYGMRANEDPFAWMMAQMSAFVLEDFSGGTVEDKSRHTAMAEMVNRNMSDRPGNPLMASIHMDITAANLQAQRASERHDLTTKQYKDLVSGIEDANQEETAISILRLQTQMEASYTVTSRLSQLSLVNFLG